MDLVTFQQGMLLIRCLPMAVTAYIAENGQRLTPRQRSELLKRLKKGDTRHVSILDRGVAKLEGIYRRFLVRHPFPVAA